MATAYVQRPKFTMAEHSATAEGEKCGYGSTLQKYMIKIFPSISSYRLLNVQKPLANDFIETF